MRDQDTVQMIERCISEIEMLRAQVASLKPKADAYDMMKQVLGLLPQPSQGYGEDLVWRLRRQIDEIKASAPPAGQTAGGPVEEPATEA